VAVVCSRTIAGYHETPGRRRQQSAWRYPRGLHFGRRINTRRDHRYHGIREERRMTTLRTIIATVLVAGSAGIAAAASDPVCLAEARANAKACRTACAETFQTDRDACRNVDHDCAEACRAGRARCTEPFDAIVEACLGDCRTALQAAKAACPAAPDPTRDACLDAAQLQAFTCRDTCRENQSVRDGIRNCRASFRACMRRCPRS
jgi:hypothetical protein